MFGAIVKDLYLGKSKIQFFCNKKDYLDGKFEITPMMPKHQIYVTGIPKGAILDNFRIQRTFWSSYYEDDIRGYLFQVTDGYPKLIIKQ